VDTAAASIAATELGPERSSATALSRSAVLWALAGLTAVGVAIRFASLGLQSYHHDEVVTAMRVLPGSFEDMLHRVKTSESNPPLYYVLAWGWIKAFGSGEFGLRSLTALFGAATVPVGYLLGRALADRRTGLTLAVLVAVNPMLIWYSQEARSYALLVFFCALSLLFFVRVLQTHSGLDLALWALTSALALYSHYFAFFAVGIEAVWLLVALRSRWRLLLPALAAVGAAGLALVPLIAAQANPDHIGWIGEKALPARLWATGVSFLIGETGHVIAEPPRTSYALVPLALIAAGAALALLRGERRERRGAVICLVIGLGVVALASAAALAGKDYVIERNLLPALVPLLAVAAIGFAAPGARRVGLLLAVALCAYWTAFAIDVTQTPNLQRPDFRTVAAQLGPPAAGRRAIVGWRLAADPLRYYLADGSVRMYGGREKVGEVDVVTRLGRAGPPVNLPPSFHLAQRLGGDRFNVLRFVSSHPVKTWFHTLNSLPTGFVANAVLLDGPRPAGAAGAPR
jgi:mannosyltransferase